MDASNQPPRLRVLMFTNLFPNPQDTTHGIFSMQLARELAKVCDLTVVCPLPWFPRWSMLRRFHRWYTFAQIPRHYQIYGMEVYSPKYMMLPKLSGALQGALVFLGSILTVWRMHRARRIDVINSLWLYPDGVAAGWISMLLGVPMLPSARGCDVNRMLGESDKSGQILAMLHRAPAIFSVSDALRANMVAHGIQGSKISTIPNGVNTELFFVRNRVVVRSEMGLPMDRKIIVYVGRLSVEKGLPTLIEATARLRDRGQQFLLCLIGDGPLMGELHARIEELKLTENVHLAGRQEHEVVANWFGACDVFCLPSLREGCPNVVIEALTSGRPVVASRVGGIPEMVSATTGILVEPEDNSALADALDEALTRKWDEKHIASTMRGNTWSAAADKYFQAYVSAVETGTK